MEITEVIRGRRWLPSLPLHYLLYEAFGWEENRPQFAHLSLLLKPDGKGKLSKEMETDWGFRYFLSNGSMKMEKSRMAIAKMAISRRHLSICWLFLGWNPGTEQEILPWKNW